MKVFPKEDAVINLLMLLHFVLTIPSRKSLMSIDNFAASLSTHSATLDREICLILFVLEWHIHPYYSPHKANRRSKDFGKPTRSVLSPPIMVATHITWILFLAFPGTSSWLLIIKSNTMQGVLKPWSSIDLKLQAGVPPNPSYKRLKLYEWIYGSNKKRMRPILWPNVARCDGGDISKLSSTSRDRRLSFPLHFVYEKFAPRVSWYHCISWTIYILNYVGRKLLNPTIFHFENKNAMETCF